VVRLARISTVVVVAGLFASGAVFAADLPVKAPVYRAPPPVAFFSWTGCYVGGNVGGLWARSDWTNLNGTSLGGHDADGWLGGVQAGCNYQVDRWVFGVQGDYDWARAKGSSPDAAIIGDSDETKIKSLASVTGRVGYAWDRLLVYVKGGGAWERNDYRVFVTATGATVFTGRDTRSGWTVGAGAEYAFNNWLSGFVEYDYYDFGTRGVGFFDNNGGFFGTANIREDKHVAKVGLNLRWGPGPVVARY
jgi:outer membrane immunogenic protein